MRLAARPVGLPKSSDWSLTQEPVRKPGAGEVVVKTHYISVDPAMRGWMNDMDSYLPKLALGDVMRALTVGEVIESHNDDLAVGDYVAGVGGVQDYAVVQGQELMKIDLGLAPLQAYLNTLGIAGLTAYCGLVKLGEPKAGQTVLVSGAAGSVGAHVGQIAKIKGCRVIGIAGGKRKCDFIVDELGFDGAIDYKSGNLFESIPQLCPDGVDIFFDNVGGDILNAALVNINHSARVVLCGGIANYNATSPNPGPAAYGMLIIRSARMEGYIYLDYQDEWPAMIKEMAAWMADGKLECPDDIVQGGVSVFPDTLLRLFSGDNFGKLMIKVT
ncbi:MAG: NADP-dependent oxidoreductase [Rhodospirillaceae bacterium]|nr:NADP-dependent oxidoreductase [Rhodospirillaceae bacterium]MBT5894386.1 NADP-dependent oxidoreductase [Rhodospirillaceae bacterium]MBT6429648.1 NADP-dependent oxidoreductase [Rhodospirillaceae bacterium]